MKKHKFSLRIMKEARTIISIPRKKSEREELFRRINANLFGERIEGDDKPIGKKTERDIFLSRVMRYYFDINESIRRIEMCETYLLSRIPKKINKVDFLRYHYEYFLHEFYVYEQRLMGLLDFLTKTARVRKFNDEKDKIEFFKKRIVKALDQLLVRRGEHVHVGRFKSDKFDQLISLDLYSSFEEVGDLFSRYRDTELLKEKKRIAEEIKQIRESLTEIVELHMYDELGKIIFERLLRSFARK